jgi:hypothetical protein
MMVMIAIDELDRIEAEDTVACFKELQPNFEQGTYCHPTVLQACVGLFA